MHDIDHSRLRLTSSLLKAGPDWRRIVRDIVTAHGISQACAEPLIMIGRLGEGVRQIAVADELGIEGPSLVRLLDQLCAAGLVERHEDSGDRRAKSLWLTAEGRRITAEIERRLVEARAVVFAEFSQAEIETALRILDTLHAGAAKSRSRQNARAQEFAG